MCSAGLEEVEEDARRGGRGRKLQLLAGRAATRVKISERSRCCTAVSWRGLSRWIKCGLVENLYQLRVELGQTRLAIVVEDQYGVDHDCKGVSKW